MRGNNVMKGYFEQPRGDRPRRSRAAGSTRATSAVVHPDGYIELRDRAKDIIISGGENISTIEVEQAVGEHPAVLECAVVAIPRREVGGAPEGVRDAEAGRRRRPRAEIIDFCRERLAHFKCPARGRVRRAAEDLHREDPEVRAARARVGGARPARQLTGSLRQNVPAATGWRGRNCPGRPSTRTGLRLAQGGTGPAPTPEAGRDRSRPYTRRAVSAGGSTGD